MNHGHQFLKIFLKSRGIAGDPHERFFMAAILCSAASIPSLHLNSSTRTAPLYTNNHGRTTRIRCVGEDASSNSSSAKKVSEPQNALLKLAWYGSELLGIAASLIRSPATTAESPRDDPKLATGASGTFDRAAVVEAIKDDFQRSYFVTGNLTPDVYEEDCEFADPAGSFNGLCRFKRNCTNFGLLIDKSNMKLMKWEDYEERGVGHWRFSCIMSFPWKPILSATGYTEYYFDAQSGRVCRHLEHWNVPKMALLKQIFKPSRGFWRGGKSNT